MTSLIWQWSRLLEACRHMLSVASRPLKIVLNKMLGLAVQPPSRARPGTPLFPPIAARLSSERNIFAELSHKWAVATLIRHSGEVLYDKLSGKVADSAHPLPEASSENSTSSGSNRRRDRAYFYFPDLKIEEPGRYKIRISLMQMDYSSESSPDGVAQVCETIDSRSIIVEDREPSNTSIRK